MVGEATDGGAVDAPTRVNNMSGLEDTERGHGD
jgi:hypothetical protein